MSVARTKVFGMQLAVDPKLFVLLLIVAAGLIYYFTSSSDGQSASSAAPVVNTPVAMRPIGPSLNARVAARRANAAKPDRGTLKLVAVDGSRGNIDPTLRLRLLERLQSVPEAQGLRNLFDAAGNAPVAANLPALPAHPPRIMPQPLPGAETSGGSPTLQAAIPFSISLKYYGFVKPTGKSVDGNRGFFMDGENILVGGEGDVLEKRFLVVALTPNGARLEDTQAKQGQELQVTPEAPPSQ